MLAVIVTAGFFAFWVYEDETRKWIRDQLGKAIEDTTAITVSQIAYPFLFIALLVVVVLMMSAYVFQWFESGRTSNELAQSSEKPDYKQWDKSEILTLWNAAHLWAEQEPVVDHPGGHPPFYQLFQDLKADVDLQALCPVGQTRTQANRHTRVTRAELRRYAVEHRKERPKFLFPSERITDQSYDRSVRISCSDEDRIIEPEDPHINRLFGDNYRRLWNIPIRVEASRQVKNVAVRVVEIHDNPQGPAAVIPYELPLAHKRSHHGSINLDPGITERFLLASHRQGESIGHAVVHRRYGDPIQLLTKQEMLGNVPSRVAQVNICRVRIEVWAEGEKLGEQWVKLTILGEDMRAVLQLAADYEGDDFVG